MNKLFLKELFRLQIELEAKIAACDNALKQVQAGCDHCSATSADAKKIEKRMYQEAESSADALINFYLKMHG